METRDATVRIDGNGERMVATTYRDGSIKGVYRVNGTYIRKGQSWRDVERHDGLVVAAIEWHEPAQQYRLAVYGQWSDPRWMFYREFAELIETSQVVPDGYQPTWAGLRTERVRKWTGGR